MIIYTLCECESEKRTYFFVKDNNNNYKIGKFWLDISGDILSIFGFLIYLEIIVFNCYKLDYNIKTNIMRRSFGEINKINSNDDNEDDENDENNITIEDEDKLIN